MEVEDFTYKNKRILMKLCEEYDVNLYVDSINKFYYVSVFPYSLGGRIIDWERLSVRDPDWEWIGEQVLLVALEVFQ